MNIDEFKKDKAELDEIIKAYRNKYNYDSLEVRKCMADDFGIEHDENIKPEDIKLADDDDIYDEDSFWGLDDYTFAQGMQVLDDIDKDGRLFVNIVKQYVHHLVFYPGYVQRAMAQIEEENHSDVSPHLDFAKSEISRYKAELNEALEAIKDVLAMFDRFSELCEKYGEDE